MSYDSAQNNTGIDGSTKSRQLFTDLCHLIMQVPWIFTRSKRRKVQISVEINTLYKFPRPNPSRSFNEGTRLSQIDTGARDLNKTS